MRAQIQAGAAFGLPRIAAPIPLMRYPTVQTQSQLAMARDTTRAAVMARPR